MIDLLWSMLLIALTFALALVVYAGWGLLCARLLLGHAVVPERPGSSFWLGWAALTVVLQAAHAALPIDALVCSFVIVVGLIGVVIWGRPLAMSVVGGIRRRPLVAVCVGVAALWLINRGAAPPTNTDTGIYHLRMIQWISAYPIVRGLPNLQAELGFNNVSFLHAALLDVGYWTHRSQHLFHPLLVLVVAAEGIVALSRLLTSPATTRIADLFAAMLLIPLVHYATVDGWLDMASLPPDLTVALVMLPAMTRGLHLLSSPIDDTGRRLFEALTLAGMLGAAVCVKLSAIGFGAPLGLIVMVWLVLGWRRWGEAGPRAATAIVVLPALLLALWVVRNVFTSGYPLYPMMVGAVDVDWRVPVPVVEQVRDYVLLYARGIAEHGDPWFMRWLNESLREQVFDTTAPLMVALAGFGLMTLLALLRVSPGAPTARAAILLIPLATGLTVWLLMAPAPRFATFLFWGTACASAAIAAHWTHLRFGKAPLIAFGLLVIVSVPAVLGLRMTGRRGFSSSYDRIFYVTPGADSGLHAPPVARLRQYITTSGLVVHEPAVPMRTWFGPFVCTSLRMPTLALRVEDDIGQGFRMHRPYPTGIYDKLLEDRANRR